MLEILFMFWYCFDDRLAEWLNIPAIGNLPLEIWAGVFALWVGFVFAAAVNKNLEN